ncbi:MAG: TetR family transcriptional regulator [Bacteroidetes bacterium]|nr:TetR family transcriptional regulator [Bacteroidota bacterium]MBU1720271.1 TetR family transcriptional regulator [Bacteroidota bacterium]
MAELYTDIIQFAREQITRKGVASLTTESICKNLKISEEQFSAHFSSISDLVSKMLEFERLNFNTIFDDHDFEGINAIDILLVVGMEISSRFRNVSPSFTFELKTTHPEIYQKNFEDKSDFIFNKIKINLEKGISQGMYRDDLSIELVARLYLSKLIDIHNPQVFPHEEYTFGRFFDIMFDTFIRNIANEAGLKYYEERKKFFTYLNFPKG